MLFHEHYTINSSPQGSHIVLFIFFGLHRQISSYNARSWLMSRDLYLKREISQLKTRILWQDLDVLYRGISSYILPHMTIMGHHNTKSKSQSIVILCLSQLCRSGFDPICWKLLIKIKLPIILPSFTITAANGPPCPLDGPSSLSSIARPINFCFSSSVGFWDDIELYNSSAWECLCQNNELGWGDRSWAQ